jgi:hypothetical protein
VIAAHLLAVVTGVLAAPSGPWPSPTEGASMAPPPQFAFRVSDKLTFPYLRILKLTHNYHFPSNRPAHPGVCFEVRLKDEAGKEVATVQIPDAAANRWVRHRQVLLAQGLGEDQPVLPPPGELIAAPGREVPKAQYWEPVGLGRLRLRSVDVNQVPRDRPVMGPSDWSLLLARSYTRYLCRTHGAARAEILRHHQDPIPPTVLFLDTIPSGAYDPVVSEWGELTW